jgi:poly(beta-D-mannuronate) lyase
MIVDRKKVLIAVFGVAVAVPASIAGIGAAATRAVTSIAALNTAVAAAAPGDTITLAAGTYTSGTITIKAKGTAAKPITVAAAKTGAAVIAGTAKVNLTGAANVVVQGFRFETKLTVPVGANAVRVARNTFRGTFTGAFLDVSANDSQVDHNAFENKTTEGVYLQIGGPGKDGIARRVHVHHNLFFNHSFAGANGGESIRIGLSTRQKGDGRALIEDNLFDKANGDVEAISVKASNNTIRHNTIINSKGTITLRHGNGSTVDGNILIGGTTGIRVFGNNQTVINNVVQDTKSLGLEVGGGEIKDDVASTTDHDAADNLFAAFNTISGTGRLVAYGSDKEFAPGKATFDANILVGKGGTAVTGTGTGSIFKGNVLFGAAAGTMPAAGVKTADPKLVKGAGGLSRLSAGSPAVGAGTGVAGKTDIDGQARGATPDAGADQFAAATPARPLTRADVGPAAR